MDLGTAGLQLVDPAVHLHHVLPAVHSTEVANEHEDRGLLADVARAHQARDRSEILEALAVQAATYRAMKNFAASARTYEQAAGAAST